MNTQGRTKLSTNHNLLVICLFILGILGAAYYAIDDRAEVHQYGWVVGVILWYGMLVIGIILILERVKSGYLVAGVLAWATLGFCLLDNWHIAFHGNIIATNPNLSMTARNFVTAGVSALAVLVSHNSFHKTR